MPRLPSQETDAVTMIRVLLSIVATSVLLSPAGLFAEPAGRITGIGGIFVRSKDPKALMAWYRDVLGITLEPWGGAALRYDAPRHPPAVALNAFGLSSKYMAPSAREFMLDFAVDDLPALLDRLKAKGVEILARDDSDPSGRFAWILDPDGTKIELWEPKAEAAK
jgi:predicted enzyme related to lactoylglutathione lyase